MKSTSTNINIKNKRASFDYEFVDTYTAGKSEFGRYVLLFFKRRALGEKYAYSRVFLWIV